MSDELPLHIHEEIMKRLPVKSLIQFRSVSKSWKSLIDSSKFIAAHSVRHTQPHHLFIGYKDVREGDKHVSFLDDDSFPRQRFVPTLPLSLRFPRIVGSSYGLLCFDGYQFSSSNDKKRVAVVLNPSIRKSIAIAVPDRLYSGHNIVLGFGVCPVTMDPKIVHITQLRLWCDIKSEIGKFWNVKVYMPSSGKCTSLSSNLPSISIHIREPQVVIDRFIYWGAVDCSTVDNVLQTRNLIISFDITNENLEVVDLPDSFAILPPFQFSVSKLRESLVILEDNKDGYNIDIAEQFCCTVWMMEHGVERSFTKLFTIKAPGDLIKPVGFRNSGGPIIEVEDYIFDSIELVVYEPNSEVSNHLFTGRAFSVNSYGETLVLLGLSDCSSY
ncbi:hypothetical protein L1887_06390 [Cichorium endivia]|nr:hypothetical protein L1887_06390 [Cichorium endivia]